MPRPRKPTRLHVVEGTYREHRHGGTEPDPTPGVPPLPDGWADASPWGRVAAAEYHRLGAELLGLGLVTTVDRAGLMLVADAFGRWCYFRDRVGEGGAIQTTKSGYEQVKPSVGQMNRAADDLRKALTLFGLSPESRSKVTASPPQKEDPTEKYFSAPKASGE